MKTMNKTLLATAVALASTQTFAAGFQLNSQSATGIGRAFAGDAVIADNASVLARNPAAMAMFDSAAFSGGLTYADVSIEVGDVGSLNGIDDAGSGKIIPNIYFINPINDRVAIGWGAFSNFGTGTDSSSLLNSSVVSAPFDLIGETEVTTINFNTSLSYRFNDHLSVGAGLDIVYGEGNLSRTASDALVQAGALPTTEVINVEADGVGFGGILGATYEVNDNHRFGLSYRFSPDVTVEGDISRLGEGFTELTVPLADIFQFAGFHQLTNEFALHYTAQHTQWGNFDKISLDRAPTGSDSDALKDYGWKDSWFLSLGGTYNLNEQITLRAGYAYDFGVIDEFESLSIPDSDRQWFTAGIGYDLTPKSTIDFGIAYVKGEKVSVTEQSDILTAGAVQQAIAGGVPAANALEYVQANGLDSINTTTESGAIYYSLQYSYKF